MAFRKRQAQPIFYGPPPILRPKPAYPCGKWSQPYIWLGIVSALLITSSVLGYGVGEIMLRFTR